MTRMTRIFTCQLCSEKLIRPFLHYYSSAAHTAIFKR